MGVDIEITQETCWYLKGYGKEFCHTYLYFGCDE